MNPSAAEVVKKNSAIDRLLRWCEFLGLRDWYFVNCSPIPGVFDPKTVRRDVLKMATDECDRVIALGNVPSDVLRRMEIEHFKMPHPSPRNRQLNDPQFEKDRLFECMTYVYGVDSHDDAK